MIIPEKPDPSPVEIPTIKTIIVDDEMPARMALATYIREYCPGIDICGEYDSAGTAYEGILKHRPQLVFLDIEMPNGNGFDLLRRFKNVDFRVIFVTAFSEYAIRAFRFSAIDYLLKPVKIDELVEAVQKVREEYADKISGQDIRILFNNLSNTGKPPENMVISDINGFTVIKIADLILCQGEGYCTHFFASGKKKITSSKNLKYYEELLYPRQIIRVHHSWLVNVEHVKGLTRQGEILLSEELKCPLGTSYKTQFMEMIGKIR